MLYHSCYQEPIASRLCQELRRGREAVAHSDDKILFRWYGALAYPVTNKADLSLLGLILSQVVFLAYMVVLKKTGNVVVSAILLVFTSFVKMI